MICLQVPNALEYWQLKSMRTDLFFHGAMGRVKIEVDGKILESFPQEFPESSTIFIDEGAVYIAVIPLIGRHAERKCAMKVSETEEFIMVSLYNLDGPKQEMTDREMNKLGNGFAFEIRDASDFESFADFKAKISDFRVMDRLYSSVRRVHYANPENRLSIELCPYTNTVKYATVNGLLHQVPQFEINGEVPDYLPFLDGKQRSGYADWDWLKVQMEREAEKYNPGD